MNPDGTGVATFDTLPANFSGYAHSPVASKVAFGYSSTGTLNPQFKVFANSSVTTTGATTVDSGPYIFVGSLMFTADGSKIIYIAQKSTGNSGVYIANSNGSGSPTRLDDADDATLSPDGTVVVYSRSTFSSGTGQVCRRNTDGSGFVQITNNAFENVMPQWTKEGDRILFSSDRSGIFNIWSMDGAGGSVQQLTTSADPDYGASSNTGDTEVVFTKIAFNSQVSGIYKVAVGNTTEAPLFVAPDIDSFVYWTGTNGRAEGVSGMPCMKLSPRERRLLLRR